MVVVLGAGGGDLEQVEPYSAAGQSPLGLIPIVGVACTLQQYVRVEQTTQHRRSGWRRGRRRVRPPGWTESRRAAQQALRFRPQTTNAVTGPWMKSRAKSREACPGWERVSALWNEATVCSAGSSNSGAPVNSSEPQQVQDHDRIRPKAWAPLISSRRRGRASGPGPRRRTRPPARPRTARARRNLNQVRENNGSSLSMGGILGGLGK